MASGEMGPLEMVWAKDALCEALERFWGHQSGQKIAKLLMASTGKELEREYKAAGLELMGGGKKECGWELAKLWSRVSEGGWMPSPLVYSLDEEDEDEAADREAEAVAPKSSGLAGLARGIGRAFAKKVDSTTHQLGRAADMTIDHAGPVTQWGDGMGPAGGGKVSIELAKAELSAIARSKLGSKATKLIDRVDAAQNATELALAIGESQRKLVKAGLPRLAAKMALKWLELKGRLP